MSRLESHIRRLEAQRQLLDWAASIQENRGGLALDLGLGNGRTYSHLRERLPTWRIVAFDRQNAADPKSLSAGSELVLGEFRETLPAFAADNPCRASLIHSDAGLSEPEANLRQMTMISRLIPKLAAPGAIVLSDQRLDQGELLAIRPPVKLPEDRYFVYKVTSVSRQVGEPFPHQVGRGVLQAAAE